MNKLGKTDTITREYLKKPEIFADAFNKFLYHGRQIIQPERLLEMDTAEIVVPYGSDGAGVPEQRYRDVMKLMMTDGNTAYCLLGVENQTNMHYAMPVKNMVYDALQYAHQVSETAQAHKKDNASDKRKRKSAPSADEFLSGFYKTDRILPVVTLVIFFNSEAWDAPVSLKEMFSETDESIMRYAADYRVNLIAPNRMTDAEFEEFHTSLKEVMIYTKYASDKKKLNEAVHKYDSFRRLERQAAEVINVTTNSNLKYQENEEEIDMCLAIKEMREESMQQGIKLGEQRGIQLGEQRGEQRGMQQGVELLAEAIRLLRDGVTEAELRMNEKYSDAVIQNAVLLK